MNKIVIDLDDLCFALESSGDCFINVDTGEVSHVPDEYEDMDGLFKEARERLEANEDIWTKIDPFPSNMSFSIMEDFANQLPANNGAKEHLLGALGKNRPFRRFKDVLDKFLDMREKWFAFKNKEMEYWAAWWLRKNGIEADVVWKQPERQDKASAGSRQ
jgi:hypothetical protein